MYGRTWHTARPLALLYRLAATALARRPCDLRHAALSLWLNAGASPAQIAARAGQSVTVLLTVYAHCIDGQDQITNRLIERALRPASPARAQSKRFREPPVPPGPCPLTCIAAVTQVVPRWPHLRFAGVLHCAPLP